MGHAQRARRVTSAVLLAAGVAAAVLLGATAAAASGSRAPTEPATRSGADGRLRVVVLNGTFREMGRQYGRLLAKETRGLNREVRTLYDRYDVGPADDSLTAFSRRMLGLYPARFRRLARGVADGAGVKLDVVAENSEFFEYLAAAVPAPSLGDPRTGACSAITAWGPYTGDGSVLMGRDFDFPSFYRALDPYLVVVVLHPTDGSTPTALLTWAGAVGGISGFSARGFVLENNDGSSYGDPDRCFGLRTPFLVQLPQVLLDQVTFAGVDAAMRSYRGPYPLIWNLATPQAGYVYETTTYDVKRRDGAGGLVVGVNHFTDPSWPALPTRDEYGIAYSELRHGNLVSLAAARKGRIDAAAMRAIMDTLIDDGGPTPAEENIYRFVAAPGTLQWWIKAPGHMDWVHVDLARAFAAAGPQLTVLRPSSRGGRAHP